MHIGGQKYSNVQIIKNVSLDPRKNSKKHVQRVKQKLFHTYLKTRFWKKLGNCLLFLLFVCQLFPNNRETSVFLIVLCPHSQRVFLQMQTEEKHCFSLCQLNSRPDTILTALHLNIYKTGEYPRCTLYRILAQVPVLRPDFRANQIV